MNISKNLDFKKKNILVTGSSRGIGFEIGKSFLDHDCKVIFTVETIKIYLTKMVIF